MSEILPHLFQVGDWRADANQNLMWHGSRKIHLEPKAMAILQYLVIHANDVVSREVLFAEFWKNQVVTEDALNRAMWNIRRSLGDTPNNPQYIATIRNRGYKLIAPTTLLEDPRVKEHQASVKRNIERNHVDKEKIHTDINLEQSHIQKAPQKKRLLKKRQVKLWVIYSSIAVTLCISLMLLMKVITDEDTKLLDNKLSRHTYSQAQNIMPATSANAESLIYIAKGQGIPNQLKLLNNVNNKTYQIGNREHSYSYPTFHKDNVSLAVVVDKPNNSELAIININSGENQSIIKLQQTSYGLSWHPEQDLLAYTQGHPTSGKTGIFTVHTKLKQPHPLTDSGSGIKDLLPTFSPDGENIAFVRHFSFTEQALFIVNLQGETQRISVNFSNILSYVWLNEEALLLSLPKGMFRLSLSGELTSEGIKSIENNNFSTLDMNYRANKEQLIFSQANYSTQVASYPFKKAGLGHNLTQSQANDTAGVVSTNGHRLAFVSNRTGETKIWLLQGNKLSHVESSISDYIYDLRWSPDSNKLIATLKINNDYFLFTYHADTDHGIKYSLGRDPVNIADWQTSDAVFFTKKQNDNWHLYQYNINSQKHEKLSDINIFQARITPDKRQIVYTSHKSSGVWLWNRVTAPKLIKNSDKQDLPSNWFVDDEYLYYLSLLKTTNKSQLWKQDLITGKLHRLAVYPMFELDSRSQKLIYNFTVSKITQLNGDIWSINLKP